MSGNADENDNNEGDDGDRYSDIDLNASYSDDDYESIPIDENKLREYQHMLEQNSLSEMNQLQEEQQRLENQERES